MTERQKKDDEIERAALVLYDRVNPEPDRIIHVSKHECIKMARNRSDGEGSRDSEVSK